MVYGIIQVGGRRASRTERNGDEYNQNSLYEYKNHSYKSKNMKFKGKVTINPIIPVLLNMSLDVRDQAIISSQTLTFDT